jgi:hypothetical protein
MYLCAVDAIVEFYRGAPTPRGVRLVDIWDWSLDQLEDAHDYIQWLFPLDTPSSANPDAPLATEETARAFKWDEVLKDRLQMAYALMLRFYGLELLAFPDGTLKVIRAKDFQERRGVWIWPNSHNHLRLSRILKSLRLLGLKKEAQALFKVLEDVYRVEGRDIITVETYEHWRAAAGRS